MSCDEVRRWLADAESAPAAEAVAHVLECGDCRALWMASMLLDRIPAGSETSPGASCPPPERLAALVLGEVAEGQKGGMIHHVATCEACVRELAEACRDLDRTEGLKPAAPPADLERRAVALASSAPALRAGPTQSPPRRWAVVLPAAAGVTLLAVGLGLLVSERAPAPQEAAAEERVLRSAPSGVPRPMAPLAPQGEVRATDGVRFAWEVTGGDAGARYRLVVADLERGETLVQRLVDATSYTLTREEAARLRPGVRYHWLVEPVAAASGEPSESKVFWLSP